MEILIRLSAVELEQRYGVPFPIRPRVVIEALGDEAKWAICASENVITHFIPMTYKAVTGTVSPCMIKVTDGAAGMAANIIITNCKLKNEVEELGSKPFVLPECIKWRYENHHNVI